MSRFFEGQKEMQIKLLKDCIAIAGNQTKLGNDLGIAKQTISKWNNLVYQISTAYFFTLRDYYEKKTGRKWKEK